MNPFKTGRRIKVLQDPFCMGMKNKHATILGMAGKGRDIYVRAEVDGIRGDWLFEPWGVELVNEHKEFTDEEYESLLV